MADRKKKSVPFWVGTLAGAGALALTLEFLDQFNTHGSRIKEFETDGVPPPEDDMFIYNLSQVVGAPVRRGGTLEVLNNGDEFFPVLMDEIERAEKTINLMSYVWRSGRMAEEVFAALEKKAGQGVEVRVMIDGIGSLFLAPSRRQELKESGVHLAEFLPLVPRTLPRLNNRNHRRAYLFDGKVGFTGGMSIADHWLGDGKQPGHWRDSMVRVTGPFVESLQYAFTQLWAGITGELLVGPHHYPQIMEDDPESKMHHLGVVDSPGDVAHPLLHLLWLTFLSAKNRIYVTNSYFVPDRYIRQIILDKAREGVDIRLLVPGRHIDNPFVRWAARYYYPAFLEAGVRIHEYQDTMMHAKHIVVDGCWTVVGSANIDIRSIRLNQENVLGIWNEDVGRRYEEIFMNDLKQAREITLEDMQNAGPFDRARSYLSLPFEGLY